MAKKLSAIITLFVFLVGFNSLALADEQVQENQITDQNSNTGADSNNQNTTNTSETDAGAISNTNTNTGPNSDNQNTQNLTEGQDSSTQITTTVDENNNTNLSIDTGTNAVEHSSMVDNFTTGDISGQIAAVKKAGSTLAADSQVQIKSAESDNEVNSQDFNNMDSKFIIGNGQITPGDSKQFYTLNSTDTLNLDMNTGMNDFKENTVINNVTTGNIDFATNLFNLFALNDPELLLNLQVYSILGDLDGNILVDDMFTNESDAVSIMEADSLSTHESITDNTNVQMDTGNNVLEQNTLSGDITSGDAAAGYFQNDFAGLLSKANFFIVNVLGGWAGINSLAGRDNIIVNVMNPNSEPSGSQINNEGTANINIDTALTANATTGKNSFRRNTVVGSVTTGHINILENVVNLKSTLRSLKNKLNIRIVNILGNWKGNLDAAATTPSTPPTTGTDQTTTPAIIPPSENSGNDSALGDQSQNQVLGVSEVAQANVSENNTDFTSTVQNPGDIQAGTNLSYLLSLLLLIPAGVLIRLLKKA